MNALIISAIVSFFTTFVITPNAMRFLYAAGIVGLDMHKKKKPKLPASGGTCVAAGILTGLLTFVGIKTFVYGINFQAMSIHLLAVVSSIVLVTFIGLLDDLNVKSRPAPTKDGKNIKIGFPLWIKPLLTLPAAIPLMVISAGETTMAIPILGDINFFIFYPLLLVPIGVIGASNMVNMLGGFNGSEAGMGIIYTLSLGLFSLLYNKEIAAIIFFTTFASLLAFIKFNWYPAKLLPGDSLTYLLGSIVAAGVIVGNMEKIGLIVMTPFIIQGILKFYSLIKRRGFASDLGVLQKDGSIKSKYGRNVYSWTHMVMNFGRFSERQITIFLIIIQIIFAIIPFLEPLKIVL